MGYALSEAARREGHRLHVHDTLGSTNTEALERARAGEAGPLWVVARRQSAGRGRRGNAWISADGNLAASVLWPVGDAAPEAVATLGFVAGLAVIGALDDVAASVANDRPAFVLKWPNDVLADVRPLSRTNDGGARPLSPRAGRGASPPGRGRAEAAAEGEGASPIEALPETPPHRRSGFACASRTDDEVRAGLSPPGGERRAVAPTEGYRKLAGILLEAETAPDGGRSIVIGWGVNVAAAPDRLPYPATSLAALGVPATPEALFEALTARFVEAARLWNQGRGFADIRRRWLARAAGLGAAVSVRLPGGTISGIHDGIDEGGRLVILAPDGARRTVTAGEVHFGTAATAA